MIILIQINSFKLVIDHKSPFNNNKLMIFYSPFIYFLFIFLFLFIYLLIYLFNYLFNYFYLINFYLINCYLIN